LYHWQKEIKTLEHLAASNCTPFVLISNNKVKLASKVTGTANNKLGDVRSASLLTLLPRYSP
jgi:hypothetical protein